MRDFYLGENVKHRICGEGESGWLWSHADTCNSWNSDSTVRWLSWSTSISLIFNSARHQNVIWKLSSDRSICGTLENLHIRVRWSRLFLVLLDLCMWHSWYWMHWRIISVCMWSKPPRLSPCIAYKHKFRVNKNHVHKMRRGRAWGWGWSNVTSILDLVRSTCLAQYGTSPHYLILKLWEPNSVTLVSISDAGILLNSLRETNIHVHIIPLKCS